MSAPDAPPAGSLARSPAPPAAGSPWARHSAAAEDGAQRGDVSDAVRVTHGHRRHHQAKGCAAPSPTSRPAVSRSRSRTRTPPRSARSSSCRGDAHRRREGEPPARLRRRVRGAVSTPGKYTLYCPGADTERSTLTSPASVDQSARAPTCRRCRRPARRATRLRRHAGAATADGRERVRQGVAAAPTSRRRKTRLHEGAVRSTRRSSRWPSRSCVGKDDLDADHRRRGRATCPPRSGRVSTRSRRGCSRPKSAQRPRRRVGAGWSPTSSKLQHLTTGLDLQAVRARQRCRRACSTRWQQQDHRRGGAVLAHRPARLARPTTKVRSRPSPTSSRR